ncbi:MAG: hypothetical protein IJD04_02145 [Desulfovibrionaceae bacterium]|nr:hypothetical protein [Desulfovibrionaceae bacterium]
MPLKKRMPGYTPEIFGKDMSQKKAKEQRRTEREELSRPLPPQMQEPPPLPENSTNTYTLTLKDSMLGWYSWQLRPRPRLRRLLLVLAVAVAWATFLNHTQEVDNKVALYLLCLGVIPMYFAVSAGVATLMGFMSWQIRKVQFRDVVMYWNDEEIAWRNEIYSPRHPWRQFKAHHVTSRLVILALQGTMLIIPTRAFKNQADLDNFTAIAARRAVGPSLNLLKKSR